MRRYYLKVGDRSTAGGTVTEGIEGCYHHGTLITFLGAHVYCPACKSTGRIVAKGPRWPDNLMGKNAALDGDLCVCRCDPPPVMLPSQNSMCQSFDAQALERLGFGPIAAPLKKEAEAIYDEQIQFKTSEGIAISHIAYKLILSDGSIEEGMTDADGKTRRIATKKPIHILRAVFDLDKNNETHHG